MSKELVRQNQQASKSLETSSPKTGLKDFMRPWAKLIAAYPRSQVTEAMTTVYHERLQRYDADLIMAAVNLAIDRCTFFPSVAELIENIAAIGARTRTPLLDAPRPSRKEARAVLAKLHEVIEDFEVRDLKVKDKRLAERKELLKRQAQALGVKVKK